IAVYVEDAARTIGGLIESSVEISGDIVTKLLNLDLRAQLELYVVGYGGNGDPAPYMQVRWQTGAYLNWANISDPDIDQWIWEVDIVSDAGGVRQEMFDNITTKVQSLYPHLFFYQQPAFAALSCKFEGNPTWTAAYFYTIKYNPDCPSALAPIPGFPTFAIIGFSAIAIIFIYIKKKR
ncbi:unnamed protein product, partial [marine sediment metagenome]